MLIGDIRVQATLTIERPDETVADLLAKREAMLPAFMRVRRLIADTVNRIDGIVAGLKAGVSVPSILAESHRYQELERESQGLSLVLGPLEERIEIAMKTVPSGDAVTFRHAGRPYVAWVDPILGLTSMRTWNASMLDANVPDADDDDDDGEPADDASGDESESPTEGTVEGVAEFTSRDGFRAVAIGDSPEELGLNIQGRPETMNQV
ncbi:hypothetical protein [Paludisphaera rhizosphaerae]|uniref:hypothetical protein n=1 Tax=Paludisphaera rhizosphaerae TaxID=2711216 RepID=UPI0013EA0588|nr:hypothetical protein [Paludisphaera rhizosphaerae]